MTNTVLTRKVRYSTRNTRGRFFQRLLLDTARCLSPVLPGSRRSYGRAALHVSPGIAKISLMDGRANHARPAMNTSQTHALTVMTDALARQIARLTGVVSFELSTWHHTLITQPVSLVLTTPAGRTLSLFNPSSCANRYFHAIVELSSQLETHFGDTARRPGDLDLLIEAGLLRDWVSDSTDAPEAGTFGSRSVPLDTPALLLESGAVSAARRALSPGCIPESLLLVEEYEDALATGTIRQTSRWGQEGAEAAAERTKKRYADLNPNLAADLRPMSRSLRETPIEVLKALANARPLTHLAVEFGVSDNAIRKHLQKAGWVSPRAKKSARSK